MEKKIEKVMAVITTITFIMFWLEVARIISNN